MQELNLNKNQDPPRQHICNKIEAFFQKIKSVSTDREEGEIFCDLKTFTMLLGSLSACRRMPGLSNMMNVEGFPECKTEEDAENAKQHLARIYNVVDAKSLLEACDRMFQTQDQFEQFQSFWDGTPVFDESRLNEHGRRAFSACKDYAEIFRPYVGRQGFLAWDINEQIGLIRNAAACGLVDADFFWTHTQARARRASLYYNSWQEYAMSCLCGAIYYMFIQYDYQEDKLEGFCDINLNCLEYLFFDCKLWRMYGWYRFEGKRCKIPPYEIRLLLPNWEGPTGCLATDPVTIEGRPVGYMYREEPLTDRPDSGWRFFAGDETEEYVNNSEYSSVYTLNTICNYSPDIVPLLDSPVGTAYFRKNGVLQKEAFVTPEE